MVKDNKFSHHKNKRIRRTVSWRDAFRGLTSAGETISKASGKHGPSILKTPKRVTVSFKTEPDQTDGESDLADAESEEDEDEGNLDVEREEDRPICARIRYEYPQVSSHPHIHSVMSNTELERQQEELSAAVEAANTEALKVFVRKDHAEPIGTRLTMTSRTGYFQDRIVSPSMVRFVASQWMASQEKINLRRCVQWPSYI